MSVFAFKVLQLDDDVFEAVEGEADTLAGLLLERLCWAFQLMSIGSTPKKP